MAIQQQKAENQPFWSFHSIRLRMAVMLALGMAVHALLRGVLGMALVCMVKSPNYHVESMENETGSYTVTPNYFQVAWNMREISAIFMFFYAGTFLSVFAAHYFVMKFGPKLIISWGIAICILSTWALPFVIYLTPVYIITSLLRFITGLAQGFYIPCCSLLISKWFRESEKSTAMAIFTTGNQIGLAISMYCTAELCKIDFMSGWPLAFLAYGLLGLIFLTLWLPFASDRPRQSPQITAIELSTIRSQVGASQTLITNGQQQYTPYSKLLFSPVILAICLSSFCQSFVTVAMTSYLPEFNRSALGLSLQQNALWSAMPFAIHFISKLIFGFVADYAKSKEVDVDVVTKISNTISSFGCAVCLVLIGYVDQPITMLVLLCASLSLTAGYVPGYNTSIVCIAPMFTAAISAYAQGFAQVASILAPIAVGFITEESTLDEWINVFRVLAGILIITGVVFLIFGSAKLQSWARPAMTTTTSGQHGPIIRPVSVERPLGSGSIIQTATMALIEEEEISEQ
ncbi:MFS domain-containing protein [Aphelenchoides besseyi]|nr:MFS domain-containing protein [Aphelenchoides besseyi]